jgi:hypothetical protein
MCRSWRDPVVTEIRRIREEYAARYAYDIEAICRAAREKQAKSGRKVVTLRPKPVTSGARAASRAEAKPAH